MLTSTTIIIMEQVAEIAERLGLSGQEVLHFVREQNDLQRVERQQIRDLERKEAERQREEAERQRGENERQDAVRREEAERQREENERQDSIQREATERLPTNHNAG